MGVSLNGGTPKTPKMIIFSRKTNGCWVPPLGPSLPKKVRLANKISLFRPFFWTCLSKIYPLNPRVGSNGLCLYTLAAKKKTLFWLIYVLYTCEGFFTRHFVICIVKVDDRNPGLSQLGFDDNKLQVFFWDTCTSITKNFRYLKWRNPESFFWLFRGWVFHFLRSIHTAY